MITKNTNPVEFLVGKNIDPIIEIYFQVNHLKHLLRQGWLMRGVPEDKCESVGDHCFAVALVGMLIAKKYFPKLDMAKIIKISLIHELGEIDSGDLTPFDKVSKEERYAKEKSGIEKIFSRFPEGKEYLELWEEFEENKSPETKFVKQIDQKEIDYMEECEGKIIGYEFKWGDKAAYRAPQEFIKNYKAEVQKIDRSNYWKFLEL